jgi:hypothetical protein
MEFVRKICFRACIRDARMELWPTDMYSVLVPSVAIVRTTTSPSIHSDPAP